MPFRGSRMPTGSAVSEPSRIGDGPALSAAPGNPASGNDRSGVGRFACRETTGLCQVVERTHYDGICGEGVLALANELML